jgi:hypothetical protein
MRSVISLSALLGSAHRRDDYAQGSRGGVHFDGFAYNFSRMHLNVAKSTRKKAAMFQHPVLIIEKDHHKDLALFIGQLALQKFPRHRWRQRGFFLHAALLKTARQLGNPSAAHISPRQSLNVLKLRQIGGQQAVQRTKTLSAPAPASSPRRVRYVKTAPAAHHPLKLDAVAQHFSRGIRDSLFHALSPSHCASWHSQTALDRTFFLRSASQSERRHDAVRIVIKCADSGVPNRKES